MHAVRIQVVRSAGDIRTGGGADIDDSTSYSTNTLLRSPTRYFDHASIVLIITTTDKEYKEYKDIFNTQGYTDALRCTCNGRGDQQT